MSEIDTSKAELDMAKDKTTKANDKISGLEAELVKYKEKEQLDNQAKKDAEIETKYQEKLETEKKAMEEMMDAKLEKISLRQSTPNSNNNSGKLTKEEYLKDRENYDTALLKASLPTVFN